MQATEMFMMMAMFTMYVLLGWLIVRWRIQVRKLAHDERMRALELNQPIPLEQPRMRANPFLFPMLFLGAGLGLLAVGFIMDDAAPAQGFGFVLMFIGLFWFGAVQLNAGNRKRQEELAERQQESYLRALENMNRGRNDVRDQAEM